MIIMFDLNESWFNVDVKGVGLSLMFMFFWVVVIVVVFSDKVV